MATNFINFRNTRLTDQVVGSTTFPGLITQVNTALAALVNPTIRAFNFQVSDPVKRLGTPFYVSISYDTGGAALATPFTLSVFQNQNWTDLQTAIQTYIAANPTFFYSGVRSEVWDADDNRLTAFYAAYLLNTTAGATANLVPK